jgi:hypothetical protein
MNTFTAQELAELYKKAAEGGKIEFRYPTRTEWKTTNCGPTPLSSPNDWRIKPAKKIIDLSVLIESGIDCELWDDSAARTNIGKLTIITDCPTYPYETTSSSDEVYSRCRPRHDHIHAWQGGGCPLPEGFRVKVWFRSGGDAIVTTPSRLYWGSNSETMAFEVLGLADGYVMPWESE